MNKVLLAAGRKTRDRFLLGQAEAIVRAYSAEQHACIRQLHHAAVRHIALADESTDAWHGPAAVTLHRKAIDLLASALLVAKGVAPPGPPLGLSTALAKIEEQVAAGALPPLPERYANAKALLETPEYVTFAGQDNIEIARGRGTVEALTQWLRRQVEPRSVRQLWVARGVRVALAVAVLLLIIRFGVPMLRLALKRH
jgi:hypothetical protein